MHVGTLGFLATAAQIIIFAFLWRTIAVNLPEGSPIKAAMLFIL